MNRSYVWLAPSLYCLTTAAALADQAEGYGRVPHMWHGGWHGWFLGPVMMMIFFAVAVVVAVVLVRRFGVPWQGGAAHRPSEKTPLDILKERFAKGEIDKAEFEDRRRVLEG